jgi:O-acetyl-ADP-ribose deacetylase (regulator of RNase III)
MNFKNGDLMAFDQDCFGHGCNCRKRMASGVAAAVRKNFFAMVEADQNNTLTDDNRLGTFEAINLPNGKIGYNIYTQLNYGRDTIKVDYNAMRRAFIGLVFDMNARGLKSIALPRIGCGLAGGDWAIVEKIIDECFVGIDVTIYEFQPKPYN